MIKFKAGPVIIWLVVFILTGCQAPGVYRAEVDQKALAMIARTREQALGNREVFTVDRPSDRLRTRLIQDLGLAVAGPESLGANHLPPVPHWPEPGYPGGLDSRAGQAPSSCDFLVLTLLKALEVGAGNSSEFQTEKEFVFQAALALYLEEENFRNHFTGHVKNLLQSDTTGPQSRDGTVTSGELAGLHRFKSGMNLSTALAADLAKLFTSGGGSSLGITSDTSLSIPLLRGSARHIVTEPLKQAERNLIYAVISFEWFKQEFAVRVATGFMALLRQEDTVKNTEEDYRSRRVSATRSKRLADAGRLKEIQVDQAVQTELLARQRWVSALEQYKRQMDTFKTLLGLPPDAGIKIDPDENLRLTESGDDLPGRLELDPRTAVELALSRRLDLEKVRGRVTDAQRAVVVAADRLGAELTFLGSAALGERRTITSADLSNARLRTDKGVFSALVTLDLPFERTAEAVAYRNSFLELEQAVRTAQELEDRVKLSVYNRLRDLLEARETLNIQASAVDLAKKRVRSINLFMEAGRAETRDLLEAQDSLLSARNSLTSARVNYRIAEIEIQRDMGVLAVTDTGMWHEYLPDLNENTDIP
ncbi:MAG: TolC family protein [Desulfobacterium sp.]|nr:TolC family protein [Desulfobacterium sp.]